VCLFLTERYRANDPEEWGRVGWVNSTVCDCTEASECSPAETRLQSAKGSTAPGSPWDGPGWAHLRI